VGCIPGMNSEKIITVGFNPVWDRTCYVDGIEWGDHKIIDSQTMVPAGKALNISKALAWLSIPSTAAGLWGESDHRDMIEALSEFQGNIEPGFTVVQGASRQNVTVVDRAQNRELHLRSSETLMTQGALEQLTHDLQGYLSDRSAVIFAGSIPEGIFQDECVSLIAKVGCQCGDLIVDTSGSGLEKIVNQGGVGIIKPNLDELSELLGRDIENDVGAVISAARKLCDRVRVVIVSLARDGAVAVTKDLAFHCRAKKSYPVVHTVGCGDYLLAGYISVSHSIDIAEKLVAGVKVATAKACGLAGVKPWPEVQKGVEVEITRF
jgi:1-phosphofructokinase